MQLLQIPFKNYEDVDRTFVIGFAAAYNAAKAMPRMTDAFNPPANEHHSESFGAEMIGEDDIEGPDQTAAADPDEDTLLAGLLADV